MIRCLLRQDRRGGTAVLHIFLRFVEQAPRGHSPHSAEIARLGAVGVVHRFGSALNEHLHFHCCVIEGVFEPGPEGGEVMRFRESVLTAENVRRVQNRVRQRIYGPLSFSVIDDPLGLAHGALQGMGSE